MSQNNKSKKTAILVHDSMMVGGGGEITCGAMAVTLRDLGYHVILLAESKDFPEDLGVQLRDIDVKMLPWRNLPYWISHTFNLLYALFLRTFRRRSIMIDTLGLLMGPALADITYVHYPGLPEQRTHMSLRRIFSQQISLVASPERILR